MSLLVQRAKLCLDFSATLYFFHFLFTRWYSGQIPNTFSWWIIFIISIAALAVGGEYLCMQRELEPITLLGTRKRQTSRIAVNGAGPDLEMGELLGENTV